MRTTKIPSSRAPQIHRAKCVNLTSVTRICLFREASLPHTASGAHRCTVIANIKWNTGEATRGARSVLVAPYRGREWRNAAMVACFMYSHSRNREASPPAPIAVERSPFLCSISYWRQLYLPPVRRRLCSFG